mgnify:CR=1 FL=1
MLEIVRKSNLILSIRNFIEYKDTFPIKDVCLMTSSNINHFIVHFEDYTHLGLYMSEIKSIGDYQIYDTLDIILISYIFNIVGLDIYNQYDVLLYRKIQKTLSKIADKNIFIDDDIKNVILSNTPPEEVLTILKFSC